MQLEVKRYLLTDTYTKTNAYTYVTLKHPPPLDITYLTTLPSSSDEAWTTAFRGDSSVVVVVSRYYQADVFFLKFLLLKCIKG